MSRTGKPSRHLLAAVLLLAALPCPGFAQEPEKPLTLTGVFTTGLYTTDSKNGLEARVSTVPAILKLDLRGYIGHPDFLSYQVRPQLSAGDHAPEGGFISGNGLSLSATFLRRRNFPLTLTYSNVQRDQITYGSLTRISGLRSVNQDRDFTLHWLFRDPHLPRLSFELGRSHNTLEPDDPIIPDFDSRSRHYAVGLNDTWWGWRFDGRLRWDKFSSDFANSLEPGLITSELDRRSSQYRFSAERPLGHSMNLILNGGLIDSRNRFNDRPFEQDVRFISGALNFKWGQRWRGSFRSGYNTNLLGTDVEDTLRQLSENNGAGVSGSNALVFVPFETRVSSVSRSGSLHFQAHRDWSLFGSLSQNSVHAPASAVAAAKADHFNASSGVSFHRRFSWATLTSQYSLNVGRLDFARIPNSRLQGHTFSLVARRGTLERLELTGSFTASLQRVDQTTALRTSNRSTEFTAGRRLGSWVVRGGLGLQQNSFRDGNLDFDSDGLTLRTSAEHRRLRLQYFRNAVDTNSLQPFVGDPAASAVLVSTPLRVIVTSLRTQTLNLHAHPWRRLETQLMWTRGSQELDREVSNDYDQFDLKLRYRFRLLTFEVGYARYQQSFLTLSQFLRSRFFFRIERPFRVF